MGRAAANLALQRHGFSIPPPILKGSDKQPLWPKGIVGSISHSGDRAVAVVACASAFQCMGVDVQEFGVRHYEGIVRLVTTAKERELLQQMSRQDAERHLVTLFSAKESLYKALSSVLERPMRFADATIEEYPPGKLRACLEVPHPSGMPTEYDIGWWQDNSCVLTLVRIAPDLMFISE